MTEFWQGEFERMVRVVFEEQGGIASSYELWRAATLPGGWFIDPMFSINYLGGLTYEATTETGVATSQLYRIEASP